MPSFLFAKTLPGNIFHSPSSIHQRSASIEFMQAERRADEVMTEFMELIRRASRLTD
ncbi:MAG: hypothetical protein M3R47_01340 [Chloroflexota bacterium]|nr:hypothetical protein [Chloroflexota bacterium]